MIQFNDEVRKYYLNVIGANYEQQYKLNILIENRDDFNAFMKLYSASRFNLDDAIEDMITIKQNEYFGSMQKLLYAFQLNKDEVIRMVFL